MEIAAGSVGAMGYTVYVGNLNFSTTQEDLRAFMNGASVGSVINVEVVVGANGTSKGWGLVTFQTEAGARACIENLNGASLHDRQLNIREDRKTGAGMAAKGPIAPTGDGTSLFVNNLPWSVDTNKFAMLFAGYQVESANVVYGNDQRSRGYGILKMATPSEAERAIREMDGYMLEERNLQVRYDAGKKESAAGSFGGRGAGPQGGAAKVFKPRVPGSTIYVGNLAWSVTWQTLKDTFAQYGPEYADVKIGYDGRSRGWGTVRFADAETAQRAINEINGTPINGRTVEVRLDRGPGGGPGAQ